jgi:hypothetical protein
MAEKDDLNVPKIATAGAVSTLITIAIIYAVCALYFNYADAETRRKVVEVPIATSDSKLAEQEAKLTRYGWVNRSENTVTIPIERAMTLVVSELQQQQSESSNPSIGSETPSKPESQ